MARYYFVDESGDGTLFDRKGRCIVGGEGCSRFFIIGYLEVADPERLDADMRSLRERLLSDPYFKMVPSMQPDRKKTAVVFHAKDDVAEVRKEVFALLLGHEVKFFAAVKNKYKVLQYVQQRNQVDGAYRYQPNELYDFIVRRLLKNALHKADKHEIVFSERGKSDRTSALREAVEVTRDRFCQQHGVESTSEMDVIAGKPVQCAGLQAVDYFLWALQRMYERREGRYVEYLWPHFRLVLDMDDVRDNQYGTYYTQKRPLTLAALKELPGI